MPDTTFEKQIYDHFRTTYRLNGRRGLYGCTAPGSRSLEPSHNQTDPDRFSGEFNGSVHLFFFPAIHGTTAVGRVFLGQVQPVASPITGFTGEYVLGLVAMGTNLRRRSS